MLEDLKINMLVELRNGKKFFVMKHEEESIFCDILLNISAKNNVIISNPIYLNIYESNLEHSVTSDFDIVKVGYSDKYPLYEETSALNFSQVLWEREEFLTEEELMSLKKGARIICVYSNGVDEKGEFLAYIDDSMNTTIRTNDYYSKERKNRVVFIDEKGRVAMCKNCKLDK